MRVTWPPCANAASSRPSRSSTTWPVGWITKPAPTGFGVSKRSKISTRFPARCRNSAAACPATPQPTMAIARAGIRRGRSFRRLLHRRLPGAAGLRAEGHELFRRGRVDADRRVEILLGGAHLQRDGEALHDFAGVGADHVKAHHFLARLVDDELHHRLLVATRKR